MFSDYVKKLSAVSETHAGGGAGTLVRLQGGGGRGGTATPDRGVPAAGLPRGHAVSCSVLGDGCGAGGDDRTD